ncbi:MAG TPA: redox-sensing transcriptional repressor Rex [Nitriliruptorales bacterium]
MSPPVRAGPISPLPQRSVASDRPAAAPEVHVRRPIPEATVSRLPAYLQVLVAAAEQGVDTISSGALADRAGVNSANVRKDLSYLGTYGTRGVGYPVVDLVDEISGVLGLTSERNVVIIGLGNLGRALASYAGFHDRGFRVVALFDADPRTIGERVAGHVIRNIDDLRAVVRDDDVSIAVLAVPADAAQGVAEALVDAGVGAILNFAPAHLQVPDGVTVRKVDLSTELQILAFYEQVDAAGIPRRVGEHS